MIMLNVNGKEYQVEVQPHETLGDVLYKRLGFNSVHLSCEEGECGACTVLVEGDTVASCLVLAMQVDGKKITTVEGLGTRESLHPIQQAYVDEHGFQCGYCTPGFILSTKTLLDANPHPEPAEIADSLKGHICRCGSYPKIIRSVLRATELLEQEESDG